MKFSFKKKTIADRMKNSDIDPEIKEVFIGRNTVFSLIGFIVGGILFGNALWRYSEAALGTFATMLAGLIIFIISGIMNRQFRK